MVFSRVCFKSLFIVLYVGGFAAFFALTKFDNPKTISASKVGKIIRFCSEIEPEVLNQTLHDASDEHTFDYIVGEPCRIMKPLEVSLNVSIFMSENAKFSIDKNCLNRNASGNNESNSAWEVMECDDDDDLILQIATTAATLFFLALTLVIYAFINELKDVNGKCIIGFIFSHILAFSFSRVGFFFCSTVFDVAIIFAFLWISAMAFDVWWTLSFFDTSSGGKFKYYCYFVLASSTVVAVSVATSSLIFKGTFDTVMLFLILSSFACFVCFVFCAVKIYDLTGVKLDFGSKRLEQQENRFMMFFQLFVMTILTLAVEVAVRNLFKSFEFFLIAGILHCLQAVVFFCTLILRRNIRNVVIKKICCC